MSGVAAGDCPNSLLIVLPRPLGPVKTLAAKVFWPPVPVASPSREGVAGIRLLLQRLPVPIGPNHPSFLSFQPELPPVLDCPLLAKGAAVAMVCGCCLLREHGGSKSGCSSYPVHAASTAATSSTATGPSSSFGDADSLSLPVLVSNQLLAIFYKVAIFGAYKAKQRDSLCSFSRKSYCLCVIFSFSSHDSVSFFPYND